MAARKAPCDPAVVAGRTKKAHQFLEAAETIRELAANEADVGDAYVTLCVHAGIAAADVLCCRALGYHVQGESHAEAIAELGRVGKDHARALGSLLKIKTRAGYGDTPVSAEQRRRAGRAARQLVDATR